METGAQDTSSRISAGINTVFVVLGITFLLLVLLNVASGVWLSTEQGAGHTERFGKIYEPKSEYGQSVYQKIFGEDREAANQARRDSPWLAPHPVLHFISEPVKNENFHMGLEGLRYEPGWTDEFVKAQLKDHPKLVFAFGGSTMLGHGLAGNQTISFYLNELLKDEGALVFNFGSQAYDQIREIDKLLYLLRRGYRPWKVFFLDGWNDIAGSFRSNLRSGDNIVWHGFSRNKGEIAYTNYDIARKPRTAKLFAKTLPMMRVVENLKTRSQVDSYMVLDRDPFVREFDFREAAYIHSHWTTFTSKHSEHLNNSAIKRLQGNIEFVRQLEKSFGFSSSFFFQPVGIFDKKNPFIDQVSWDYDGHKYLYALNNKIKTSIKNNELNMVDISDVLLESPYIAYVDAAHYSPKANQALAQVISAEILK